MSLARSPLSSPSVPSALRELPLVRWATRFSGGKVVLEGYARNPTQMAPLHAIVNGQVRVEVDFEGGPEPRLVRAAVCADELTVGERTGSLVLTTPGEASLDGIPVELGVGVAQGIESLLDGLWDTAVHIEASSEDALVVKFGAGVEATLAAGEVVMLEGAVLGSPAEPRLCKPLTIRVHGAGIHLSHRPLRWLARLAAIRIQRAALHPDGQVNLHGGARRGLNRAVGDGLKQASQHLSGLVRRSPRFAAVRSFLHEEWS